MYKRSIATVCVSLMVPASMSYLTDMESIQSRAPVSSELMGKRRLRVEMNQLYASVVEVAMDRSSTYTQSMISALSGGAERVVGEKVEADVAGSLHETDAADVLVESAVPVVAT